MRARRFEEAVVTWNDPPRGSTRWLGVNAPSLHAKLHTPKTQIWIFLKIILFSGIFEDKTKYEYEGKHVVVMSFGQIPGKLPDPLKYASLDFKEIYF